MTIRRWMGLVVPWILLGASTTWASRAINPQKIAEEKILIDRMASQRDVKGLIGILTTGEWESRELAAEHLGEVGDERALPALTELNLKNGGWRMESTAHFDSGAFAVAMGKIINRKLPAKDQINAWFDVLAGRGPLVPDVNDPWFQGSWVGGTRVHRRLYVGLDLGRRVAEELARFNDPIVTPRLRTIDHRGAAPVAVWLEVRDMNTPTAIDRCLHVVRHEGGSQGYGAIQCLARFGKDAFDGLDALMCEGYSDAVELFAKTGDARVLDRLRWHALNNENASVRRKAVWEMNPYVSQDGVILDVIKVFYDPVPSVRKEAAWIFTSFVFYKGDPGYSDQVRQGLLIATHHQDPEVSGAALKVTQKFGWTASGQAVPEPPPLRTDLGVQLGDPPTVQRRLQPLEKEAAKVLETGRPEDAEALYRQLLEQNPGYAAYQEGLNEALAYLEAAKSSTRHWYPDSPYVHLKGRYEYLLSLQSYDGRALDKAYKLAQFLNYTRFEGWSDGAGKDPQRPGEDQFAKALAVYEWIVDHYPAYELQAVSAKYQAALIGARLLGLRKEAVERCLEILEVPVEKVIDSTGRGGASHAREMFLKHRDAARSMAVSGCQILDAVTGRALLQQIIERFRDSDPPTAAQARQAIEFMDRRARYDPEVGRADVRLTPDRL